MCVFKIIVFYFILLNAFSTFTTIASTSKTLYFTCIQYEYYKNRNITVFVTMLDANKTFNRVNF